jgi:uncharacterized membrane protein
MPTVTIVGRTLFAVALVGLGVEHVIFGQFVTGRAPAWPEAWPGGTAWAWVSGVAVAATGTALLVGRHARLPAVLAALLIGSWALLRHLPIVASDTLLAPSWTDAGKALTLTGGALAIAATLPMVKGGLPPAVQRLVNQRLTFLAAGRLCLGAFLVVSGIQHFMFTRFVASLIPNWFPGDPIFWTYFGGLALVAGGLGLSVPWTAWLAALMSGLMVFSWFWIVHLPRTFLNMSSAVALFEALAVSGIAFALAGALRRGATAAAGDPAHPG